MSPFSYPCGFRPQLGRAPRRAVSVCLRSSVEDSVMRKLFDFIRTHAKKCVAAAAVASGFVVPAFAADPAGGPDLSAATTALTTLKDALVGQNGWISSAAPVLAALLGGVLVVTLIWVAYKWVSRGAKKAG